MRGVPAPRSRCRGWGGYRALGAGVLPGHRTLLRAGTLLPLPRRRQLVFPLAASLSCSLFVSSLLLCLYSAQAAGLRRGSPPRAVRWRGRPLSPVRVVGGSASWQGANAAVPCAAEGEALSCCGVLHRDPQRCSAGPGADSPPLPTGLTARNAERRCKAEIVRRKSLQLPAQCILKQDNPSRGTLRA